MINKKSNNKLIMNEKGLALISAVAVLAILLVMVLAFATASIFEQRMAMNMANTSNDRSVQTSVANMICNALDKNPLLPINRMFPSGGTVGKLIVNPVNDAISSEAKYTGVESDPNLYKLLEQLGIFKITMPGLWGNVAGDFNWLMLRDADDKVVTKVAFVAIPNYGTPLLAFLNEDNTAEGTESRNGRKVSEVDLAAILSEGNAALYTEISTNLTNQEIKYDNRKKYLDVNSFFAELYKLPIDQNLAADMQELLIKMNHYYAIPSRPQQESFRYIDAGGSSWDYHRFNLARNWDLLYSTTPATGEPTVDDLLDRKPHEVVEMILDMTKKDEWKDYEKIKNDKATSILWFEDTNSLFAGNTTGKDVKQFVANLVDYFDSDLVPSSEVHPRYWALSNSEMATVTPPTAADPSINVAEFGETEKNKLKNGTVEFTGIEATPAITAIKLNCEIVGNTITPQPGPSDPITGVPISYTYTVTITPPTFSGSVQLGSLFDNSFINDYDLQLNLFIDGKIEVTNGSETKSFDIGKENSINEDNLHFEFVMPIDTDNTTEWPNVSLHNKDLLADAVVIDSVEFSGMSAPVDIKVSLKNFVIKRIVLSGRKKGTTDFIGFDLVQDLKLSDTTTPHAVVVDTSTPDAPTIDDSIMFEYTMTCKDPLVNLNDSDWESAGREPKFVLPADGFAELTEEFALPSIYSANFGIEKLSTTLELKNPVPHRGNEKYTDRGVDGDKISFMELNFIHLGKENTFFNLADEKNVTILDYLKLEDKPSNYKINLSLLTQPMFDELFNKIELHKKADTNWQNSSSDKFFDLNNLAGINGSTSDTLDSVITADWSSISDAAFAPPPAKDPDLAETDEKKALLGINSRSKVLLDYIDTIYPKSTTTLSDMQRAEIIAKVANLVTTNFATYNDGTSFKGFTPFPSYTVMAIIQNVRERTKLIDGKVDFIILSEKKAKIIISGDKGEYTIDSIQNLPVPIIP